jgi:hypothetical protein
VGDRNNEEPETKTKDGNRKITRQERCRQREKVETDTKT